jgi:hypothetical protein
MITTSYNLLRCGGASVTSPRVVGVSVWGSLGADWSHNSVALIECLDIFEGPRLRQDWCNSDLIHIGKNLVQKKKMKESCYMLHIGKNAF